jgi:hypothetical protein
MVRFKVVGPHLISIANDNPGFGRDFCLLRCNLFLNGALFTVRRLNWITVSFFRRTFSCGEI